MSMKIRVNSKKNIYIALTITALLLVLFGFLTLKPNASTTMLIPTVDRSLTIKNESTSINVSNAPEGYLAVKYNGSKNFAIMQIYKDESSIYTYRLKPNRGYEYFPFSEGSGKYAVVIYEPVPNTDTYESISAIYVNVDLVDAKRPFLYPNQYVDYSASSDLVTIANAIAKDCSSDAEIINAIYSYVASNISYDNTKYDKLSSDYLPAPDKILSDGKGICFDYAVLMTAMLRSQNIPARLELGTISGGTYHAWVRVYSNESSKVKGTASVKNNWCLVDPTLASTQNNKNLSRNINTGYSTEYVY